MAEQREKKARSPSSPALPRCFSHRQLENRDERPCTCELRAKSLISRMSETAVVHIIDDDESVRAALDGLLCSVGLTPVPHASVSEFLAAEKPDVPGCLVLDVRMPGIRQLRTSP